MSFSNLAQNPVVILSHSWRMSAACIAHHASAHTERGLCALGMWKTTRAGKRQALEYVEDGYGNRRCRMAGNPSTARHLPHRQYKGSHNCAIYRGRGSLTCA